MLRPWSQQARQLTPRRGTVAHLGNQGCCVHIHTGNLSIVHPPGAVRAVERWRGWRRLRCVWVGERGEFVLLYGLVQLCILLLYELI